MVTAIDALTFLSGKWENREGEAEHEGDLEADLVCLLRGVSLNCASES